MHESFRALIKRGWNVRLGDARELLNPDQRRRYRHLPERVSEFLAVICECSSPERDVWFFGPDDYAREDPQGIRWDECERISLEAAADDPVATEAIRRFWDSHFPIMMATHSDYDYLAIETGPNASSAVVHSYAPYFEEPSLVAGSFDEFLDELARAASSDSPSWPFDIFLGTRPGAGD
jgi:hypothetical protein